MENPGGPERKNARFVGLMFGTQGLGLELTARDIRIFSSSHRVHHPADGLQIFAIIGFDSERVVLQYSSTVVFCGRFSGEPRGGE